MTLPLMEIGMHLPHIVEQVAQADRIRLVPKLILVGFHGTSSLKSLTPEQWVVDTLPCDNAVHVYQLDTNIIPQIYQKIKFIFRINP